ncbi:fumarylacetoacetate hydrolase family protein [Devosia sp. YIM 151766]|uniref:fumarylacetoacetate hydrolase family protein n=1 Tax=Devosia sp. YIM 151766 TaxID=3017325 RepID=UPI00255C9AF3|nr:fumarylacetoacetate hydrolase family protein [Devosia sp. YIM 151766]WIY53165.1 fumarylacetoacetate hydrolase family protein [Devosia sp. YIM 151766]
MRLCQCHYDGGELLALVLDDETLVNVSALITQERPGTPAVPNLMLDLIEQGEEGLEALAGVERLVAADPEMARKYRLDPEKTRIKAPLHNPPKFFSLAINQGEGWRRATKPEQPVPLYFIKIQTAITGPYDPIIIPDIGDVGCEVELAIIIGKGGKNIPVSQAMDHVFGYTVHNDITAHALRKKSEWIQSNRKDGSSERLTYPGRYKNFDTFSPMGPYIRLASPDFDPESLEMKAFLNDDMIQQGNSNDYIFKFAEVIAYLSQAHTLTPGDIISSGTCPYVDPWTMAKTNLAGGHLVSEIEGIGRLRNPIERIEPSGEKVVFSFRNAEA